MLFRAQLYGLAQADSATQWTAKNCTTPTIHAEYPIRTLTCPPSVTRNPVRTADHVVGDRDTPTSPLTQGGAGPTAAAPQPWRLAYLTAAFAEGKGIDSRHVAFMLLFSACDRVLCINGAQ
ncbi:hypothetical protein Sros01_44330 [Streptomyces roseochromogenus]|nr:hypothetical protein Sros01_44330 [Streptomyces roseochromogenus]